MKEKKGEGKNNVTETFGVVSYTLAIAGFIAIIFTPVLSIIYFVAGLVFSLIQRKRKKNKTNKIAIILNIIGIIVTVIYFIFLIMYFIPMINQQLQLAQY